MSDIEGISILIPVYNFDIRPLVERLSTEASSLKFPVEIRCYDDCSVESFKELNKTTKHLPHIYYEELPENIGRSRIRNKLAKEAKYPLLLFLDSDSTIIQSDFIQRYVSAWQTTCVVCGGTIYDNERNPSFALRHKYGKSREEKVYTYRKSKPYDHINLNNLLLEKKIYIENQLDESIQTYGHEDTKFTDILRKKRIPIIHIDNPVQHAGLETNEVFLSKTREAVLNFYKIIGEGYGHHSGLYRSFSFLKKFHLKGIFLFFYSLMGNKIEKNLRSSEPSLFYFDIYKLKLLLDQES